MNEHDEILEKSLTRLKNNFFTEIKSVLSDSDSPSPIPLPGISDPYTPDITAKKNSIGYIIEVETLDSLKDPEHNAILKAISKYAESNGIELVVVVPVSGFMEAGKKLSQLKVDASIWDVQ